MSMAGRKPKEDRTQVRHRNAVSEWTEVEDVPFEGGPKLPPRRSIGWAEAADLGVMPGGWPDDTLRWWGVIARMPHAKLWTDADWEFAIATAEVHARTSDGMRGYTGTELRNREKLMGVFYDARRDLRIRYVEPKPVEALPAGVTSLDDFRNL